MLPAALSARGLISASCCRCTLPLARVTVGGSDQVASTSSNSRFNEIAQSSTALETPRGDAFGADARARRWKPSQNVQQQRRAQQQKQQQQATAQQPRRAYSIMSRYDFDPQRLQEKELAAAAAMRAAEAQRRADIAARQLKRAATTPLQKAGFELRSPQQEDFEQPPDPHVLRAVFLGAPNSGKSTLTNSLVGTKVSIVTRKAQTTRDQVLALCTEANRQIVILDTPGVISNRFLNKRRLQRDIAIAAWDSLEEAELVIYLVDAARRLDHDVRFTMERVEKELMELRELAATRGRSPPEAILVLNKIDSLEQQPEKLQAKVKHFEGNPLFDRIFCVSARYGTGVDELRAYLYERAKPGEWDYSPQLSTDEPALKLVSEVIREKILDRMHEEIPYLVTQRNIGWTPQPNGSLRIDQEIYVSKQRHQKILVGKGALALKAIGSAARAELCRDFGIPVHLYLTVKHKKSHQPEDDDDDAAAFEDVLSQRMQDEDDGDAVDEDGEVEEADEAVEYYAQPARAEEPAVQGGHW